MLLITGILVVLITTVVCFKLLHGFSSNGNRGPPGPSWALPFLGHLLLLGKQPHLTFRRWRSRYGPIVSWKMGSKNALALCDLKLIKELFGREAASGRDHNPIFAIINGANGLLASEGRVSSEQRAFTMRTFRELGLVKGGALVNVISEEGQRLVKYLEGRTDSHVEISNLFTPPILNNMWTFVSGEKHDWTTSSSSSDLDHINVFENYSRCIHKVGESGLMIAPWLRHVIPGVSGWTGFVKANEDFGRLVEAVVLKRMASRDTLDFIGQFLHHMEGVRDTESSFYRETGRQNLRATTSDVIAGGADTTAAALEFAMLYLSHHPGVQVELQKELDAVIGSRPPSLSDKLPYLEAVVLEVLRLASHTPIGFPHRLLEDIDDFHGYFIPKGTILFADIYNVNHDPETWTLPEEFNPSRFLNEKGELCRADLVIPFGFGRRRCVGESLAKSTLFLFAASIFQRFCVEPVVVGDEGRQCLDDVVPGFILRPKPFQVVFKLRAAT